MKKWLVERFLPMWAKETVLRDNRCLAEENKKLTGKIRELESYIAGLRTGIRRAGGKHKEG